MARWSVFPTNVEGTIPNIATPTIWFSSQLPNSIPTNTIGWSGEWLIQFYLRTSLRWNSSTLTARNSKEVLYSSPLSHSPMSLVNRIHCRGTTYDVDLVVGKWEIAIKRRRNEQWNHWLSFIENSLDVNAELFTVKSGDRVTVAVARSSDTPLPPSYHLISISTLSLDGTPDDGQYNPFPGVRHPLLNISCHPPQPSLLDSYDYAMHGRIFAIKHNSQQYRNIEVLASFGGLLFKLDGEQSQLQALEADSRSSSSLGPWLLMPLLRVYLLLRKGAVDLGMDVAFRNE